MPPLTASRGISAWQLDAAALAVVVAMAVGYVAGVVRLSRRGEAWPKRRTAAFLGLGLGSIVVVTMSSLAVYDRVLFWPRAVQYTTVLGLTPLFLALGAPLDLARRCASEERRLRIEAVLRHRVARVLMFPPLGAVVDMAALLVVYLSPLYTAALTHQWAQRLIMLVLLLLGCHFFLPQLADAGDLLPSWYGYSLRTVFALADGLLDAVPGIVVMTMGSSIAGAYYAGLHRTWGPSLHWDQTIGGGLMFTINEVVAVPFLLALFVRWIRDDERQAADVDRRLDEEAVAAGDVEPSATTRPWWESDPGPLGERVTRRGRARPDH